MVITVHFIYFLLIFFISTLDLLVDVSKLAYESWICFGPEVHEHL